MTVKRTMADFDDERRFDDLERQLRESQRTISRLQGALRTAAKYEAQPSEGESEISVLKRQLAGMQAALLKGAEESFRPRPKRHRER